MLVQSVLDLLRERQATGCVLLGTPGFYGRIGFTTTSDFDLSDVPSEYFQELSFNPSYTRGTVVYH